MTKKIVSLIPARGGSKGIPMKNLHFVCGKPLIEYSISSSLSSCIHETWVSTDNDSISKISLDIGSRVVKRPLELAQDDSSIEDVITHFLSVVDCDYVIVMQPTSPMTLKEDLNKCIKEYFSKNFSSVFSAVKTNDILFWNDEMVPINYDFRNRGRRQCRKDHFYIETGAFYMFSVSGFLKYNNRIHGEIGIVEVPFWRSFEIDTLDDIFNIERLMS